MIVPYSRVSKIKYLRKILNYLRDSIVQSYILYQEKYYSFHVKVQKPNNVSQIHLNFIPQCPINILTK